MTEFVFFHDLARQRFADFLTEKGLAFSIKEDALSKMIAIEDRDYEALPDDLQDAIDAKYDAIFVTQEAMLAQEQGGISDKNITALTINLADGRAVYAPISQDWMNRLLSVFSPQEIGQLVDTVVSAVEQPDERPLCQQDAVE